MITRFRTHAHVAGLGLFYGLVIPAALSALGWALYLPGWIGADLFVAGLRFCLSLAAGLMFAVLVTWTAAALIGEERS